jgi:ABC-2 type transport system ATP-binding protein
MSTPHIEVTDVRRSYGRFEALRGVRFAVGRGELFGLLGPNGAGKTTLLSILSGLTAASSGAVRLDGAALTPGRPDLRQRIGLAPQDLAVYPELTARENLLFFGRLYGLGGADLRRRVAEVLDSVALTDRADQRAASFSGGMKRRLNLGAAIIHGPEILYLDEPTTGVDPQSRNHLFETVCRLNAAGLTVLYTSHYMEEVQALCSRVAIMDHGRVIACGELPELLREQDGRVRLRLDGPAGPLADRVSALPGVMRSRAEGDRLEVDCRDVPRTLVELGVAARDAGVAVLGAEGREPTLEDLFLRLTGAALRD